MWNLTITDEETGDIVRQLSRVSKEQAVEAMDSFCLSLSRYMVVEDWPIYGRPQDRYCVVEGRMPGAVATATYEIELTEVA